MTRFPSRKAKILVISALAALLFVIFIGPWPPRHAPFDDSRYANATLARIAMWTPDTASGALRSGVGEADLTPPMGIPLAGYSARDPKANTGARTKLSVRAITLDNGKHRVTLVSGELLLPLPELFDAIVARTGIPRDEIYLASTHTHSGPGAYAHGVISAFALGEFDPAQLARMADTFATAITASRANLRPVELQVDQYRLEPALARTFITNHMGEGPAHDTLNIACVYEIGKKTRKPMGVLLTFSAHPTFLGKINHQADGDYPGRVQQILSAKLGTPVVFMSGAVGGMMAQALGKPPSKELDEELAQIDDFSHRFTALANDLILENPLPFVTRVRRSVLRQADIVAWRLPVDLPPTNFRVAGDWTLSPWIVDWIFHGGKSEIQFARIGDWVLWGFPADFSGELALQLEDNAHLRGQTAWVTSFSGDYIGYIMPHQYYPQKTYESRGANVYGPWAGEYLSMLANRIADRSMVPHNRRTVPALQ